MRIVVALSVLLIVALAGGLLLLPRLVTWNDYREEVTERAEAITGQNVAIGGRIDLELLPRPTLSLAQATLSGNGPAPDGHVLEVDRLDLRLKALPLLGGRFEVEEVRLVRPVLEVERGARPDDLGAALALAGSGFVLPLAAGGPSHLSVVDGRALLNDGVVHQIEAINLDVAATGPDGPYALEGGFVVREQPFAFTAQLGQLAAQSWSTLQLEVSAPVAAGEPTRLSFHGLTWSDPRTPQLRGNLSLSGNDARAALAALGGALGGGAPALPPWLGARFRLEGRLEFSDQAADLGDLSVTLADTEATGSLRLGVGPRPAIDLQLDLPHLVAPEGWPQAGDGSGLAALAALADRVSGSIDVAVQTLAYRGGTIRRLRTSLALSGSGEIAVEQARAIFPGQTTVAFTGALAGPEADAALEGALTVVTGNLRELLGWLGLEPDAVAEGRLRSLSLASQLALRDGTLRFADAELRVDASLVAGSLALSLGPRLQVAGALALDRLDLDAYWPDGEPAELARSALQAFASVDAAVEARIERLTWHGLRLAEIRLDGRSVAGQLKLNELSLKEAADSRAHLAGEVDLERETFDLEAELATARPAQLLRRLGLSPPLLLARLSSVEVDGSARGDLDAFDLALELRSEGARLALAGAVDGSDGQPRYDLAVDASHPDYPALLDLLGVPRAPGAEAAQPFSMTGRLSGDLSEQTTVAGSARLGAMSLTGRVGWDRTAPRPRLSAQLSAGDPDLDALAGLAVLAGLRLDPSVLEGPRAGAWSMQPMGLRWLGALDAELELSAKGGLVGSGFEAALRLDEGRLLVDRLAAALWQGRLEAQASLDVDRALPFLAVALDLRGIDPTALAAWLDLPPVVVGPADLYVEATTAGDSPYDLVRGLIGDVEVGLSDGRLIGAPLAALRLLTVPATASPPAIDGNDVEGENGPALPVSDLSGSLVLRRGIARTDALPFQLDGRQAELEGSIDLLLWAADLVLRLESAGAGDEAIGLRLVGPLARPQIRLLDRPEPVPSQAP